MKAVLAFVALSSLAVAMNGPRDAKGGYIQKTSGTASFTHYNGCGAVACGRTATGFTAALSQLAFGAPPGPGPGDACGRCFNVTGLVDPYSPGNPIKPTSIIVMVNDLCPLQGNEKWCGQTRAKPTNDFGTEVHFDLCTESGAPQKFFPGEIGALTGIYEEVSCCLWQGTESPTNLWNGACLAPLDAPFWPTSVCGNQGTAP